MSEHVQMTQQESVNKSSQNSNSRLGNGERQFNHESLEGQDITGWQHAVINPFAAFPMQILGLQRMLGNRAVGQMIQAKLAVGPAGDQYEQEADRIAEQVLKQSGGKERGKQGNKTKAFAPSITPLVQRRSVPASPAFQAEGDEGFQLDRDREKKLAAHRGGGMPLPDDTRHMMESQFVADFSQVRIHTDHEAGQISGDLSAEAFTHGNDIYMAASRYKPDSKDGQRLLAHELTHVVQQGGALDSQPSTPGIQRNWFKNLFKRGKKKQADQLEGNQSNESPYTELKLKNSSTQAGRGGGENSWLRSQAGKQGSRKQLLGSQRRSLDFTPYGDLPLPSGPAQQESEGYTEAGPQSGPVQQGTPEAVPAVPQSSMSTRTGFSAMTLPKLGEYDWETENEGVWGQRGETPTYYHPAEQPNPYQLNVQGGQLRQGGEALDTVGTLPQFLKDKSHRHMFTMSGTGQFYAMGVREGFQRHGRVHHTTMSGGQEAAAAGELQVNRGRLEAISDSSGHYQPGAAMTYQALQSLQSQGMDLSGTNVELAGKQRGQKPLSLSATEMMAYQPEMEAALSEAQEFRRSHPLDEGDWEEREAEVRDILNQPERRIRYAHARKDMMLQQLLQRTAGTRERLDQSAAAATQGQRDLTEFEHREARAGFHQARFSGRMTEEQSAAALQELEANWYVSQEPEGESHEAEMEEDYFSPYEQEDEEIIM